MKTNIRLRVTPEQSKAVQEICFANSVYWVLGNVDEVRYTEAEYLFIDPNRVWFRHIGNYNTDRATEGYEEVDADLFIRTNGTCVESKCEHPGINNTTGKCIACGEHIDKSEFKSTEETAIEPECQFAKYGFEKPKFECEILKYFAEDNTLVGYYKTEDGTVYAESWHSLNGRADGGVNKYNTKVHLTPIKKPWYETCKFPVLVWDEDTDLLVIRTRGEYTALYLNACNPLTNNEIEGLKQ